MKHGAQRYAPVGLLPAAPRAYKEVITPDTHKRHSSPVPTRRSPVSMGQLLADLRSSFKELRGDTTTQIQHAW